jgi:hypothetical protein
MIMSLNRMWSKFRGQLRKLPKFCLSWQQSKENYRQNEFISCDIFYMNKVEGMWHTWTCMYSIPWRDGYKWNYKKWDNFAQDSLLLFSEENKLQEHSRPLEHGRENRLLFLFQTFGLICSNM